MNFLFKYAESTVEPNNLEFLSNGNVCVRKDINIEYRTYEDNSTVKYWVYNEAKMTLDDFSKYVNSLILNNDENQLILMEAIADLYTTMIGG